MKKMRLIHLLLKSLIIFLPVYGCFYMGSVFYGKAWTRPYPTGQLEVYEGDPVNFPKEIDVTEHWEEQLPSFANNHWWKVEVKIDSSLYLERPLGLAIRSYLASYEAYWDGEFIGRNGQVGRSKAEEVPGGIFKVFLLPEMHSQPGSHWLVVRASKFHSDHSSGRPYLLLSSYDRQSQWLIIFAAFMHILAGVFMVIAIYYCLSFFKGSQEWSYLTFGLLAWCLFFWILLEYIRFYYAYPYPFHFIRLKGIQWLSFSASLLMSTFFVLRFAPAFRLLIFLQLGLQLVIGYLWSDFDVITYYYVIFALVVAGTAGFYAWWNGKAYSEEALISCLPIFATSFFFYPIYYDQVLFIAFTLFIFINLYILSKEMAAQKAAFLATRARADALKIALLKKNIQPHYLMNTLTSLISWVEEAPRVAVGFIEALAEEFEKLSAVSDLDRISIKEEIALCRSHLKVMEYRNEIRYQLQTEGLLQEEYIPPAIFLTLLENGLTHNKMEVTNAIFHLRRMEQDKERRFIFTAPGQAINPSGVNRKKEGTGMKYIRARLNSLYDGNWEIQYGPDLKGWTTTISIFDL